MNAANFTTFSTGIGHGFQVKCMSVCFQISLSCASTQSISHIGSCSAFFATKMQLERQKQQGITDANSGLAGQHGCHDSRSPRSHGFVLGQKYLHVRS